MKWNVTACTFMRDRHSGYEPGVAFIANPGESNVLVLIDADHNLVSPDNLWDYRLTPHYGAVTITH